jgi:hypothetical protein
LSTPPSFPLPTPPSRTSRDHACRAAVRGDGFEGLTARTAPNHSQPSQSGAAHVSSRWRAYLLVGFARSIRCLAARPMRQRSRRMLWPTEGRSRSSRQSPPYSWRRVPPGTCIRARQSPPRQRPPCRPHGRLYERDVVGGAPSGARFGSCDAAARIMSRSHVVAGLMLTLRWKRFSGS